MDSENSGAIFRLKNIALVRSSPVVPQTNSIDSRQSSAKKKPVISDQSATINSIFDQIYRATPLPSAILQNSNYNTSFWDNGFQFASDRPNTLPIYGIPQKMPSSLSGGVSQSLYEKNQQLHLHDIQSRQQNQYHQANFLATTTIPSSNHQSRISDSSTSVQTQHQAGSQFQWQVELNESPIENSESVKHSWNNTQENSSLIQDSESGDCADKPAIDDNEVQEDYGPTSSGKLLSKVSEDDASLKNTAVSGSSNHVTRTELSVFSSSSSSSRAQPSSSSTATSGAVDDVSARPKLRRKFVMDSLFSLNIKPLAEQQIIPDNVTVAIKGPKGKGVKRIPGSETTKLSSGGAKGATSKELAATLRADNSNHVGSALNSSEEDSDDNVKPVRSGTGLSYMANLSQTRKSTSSSGKAPSVQLKSPSKPPKTQRDRPLIHGSLVLVPLARLYSSSTASSSDDDNSESYHEVRRRARARPRPRSTVKASTTRNKVDAIINELPDLYSETETESDPGAGTDTGTMPQETLRTGSKVRDQDSPSSTDLNREARKTISENPLIQSSLPQRTLSQQSGLKKSALLDSVSQESVKLTVVAKARESPRLRRSRSASDEEPPKRDVSLSPGPGSVKRSTRSSLRERKSTESESSSVGVAVRAGVRTEEESSSAAHTTAHTVRTRRKLVETLTDETDTVNVSTDEWHKDEVLALHSAQMQVDATVPDFWIQVGAGMAERGYHRPPDACRDEWFKFSENGKKKKNRAKKKSDTETKTEFEIADIMPSSVSTKGTTEHSDLSTDLAGQKRKRRTRADIKRLAEESSEATRADDIFEFQRNQRSRVFVTIGVKNGLPLSAAATSGGATAAAGAGAAVTTTTINAAGASAAAASSNDVTSPSRASRRKSSRTGKEESIGELQSPHTMKIMEGSDPHRNQISKKNIASYVHNLSKKTVSMQRSKMTSTAPVKAVSKTKSVSRGRPRKSSGLSSEGINAAFSPRTGRVVVTATAAKHGSGSSGDDDHCNSDEYNRHMSEDEDGDF